MEGKLKVPPFLVLLEALLLVVVQASISLLSPKGVNYEVAALMLVNNKLRDGVGVLDGWDINSVDPCTWNMVRCSPEGFVVYLEMASKGFSAMQHDNLGGQPHVPIPANLQSDPFKNAFGAGSGLIRGGLGAYGERILGSSSEYVQSNISRYFSDPQYYFQVNSQYVRNKLKVVLFPFLHRGHWTRITEPVGGRLSYKPPIYDINAPDLYIPLMAFGSYLVLAGFTLGLLGKFSPEALSFQFTKALVGWFLQVLLLKVSLYSLGGGEAPLLDIVAYGGYAFTGMCVAVLGRIMWHHSYYVLIPWTCLCMAVFLVKTMKRVLFAESRSYESSKQHYLLLFIAAAQLPFFIWLGVLSA